MLMTEWCGGCWLYLDVALSIIMQRFAMFTDIILLSGSDVWPVCFAKGWFAFEIEETMMQLKKAEL
jgi:hypothetical protein